jgi:7-cyano-7-deazaguanine synthase
MEKAVVVISGGMDSTTLLYDAKHDGYDVSAISFNYGQKHKKELRCAQQTCHKLDIKHTIVSLDVLNALAPSALTREDWDVPEGHYADENMKQTVVPNRNMVMLALSTSYAISLKAKYLFYGVHSGDHAIYPDCRPDFYKYMQDAIMRADWHEILLRAPYIMKDKGDIVIRGKEIGVDYSLTWTCYKGRDKACGKCGSCVERLEAFEKAGIPDPLEYE